MFNLRAYVDPDQFDEVTRVLHAHEGARHIVLSGMTMDTNISLITAELDDAVADAVIEELTALGVRADDLSIARVQVSAHDPGGHPSSSSRRRTRSCGARSPTRPWTTSACARATSPTWQSPV